jgi:hypothetical protein
MASKGITIADQYFEYHTTVAEHFDVVSREAWCTVLLQISKIYIFSYVDMKTLRSMPSDEYQEPSYPSYKCNTYGSIEQAISRWLQYHHKKVSGKLNVD